MLDFDTEWVTGAEGSHLEHADRSRSGLVLSKAVVAAAVPLLGGPGMLPQHFCQSSWNFI